MYQRQAAAKARTVAKHHKHVKPAAATAKAATGHAHKHHKAAKHHTKVRKHKGTVARGLATGAEVACCAAEALAATLRLSGLSVSDADVLGLFRRAGGDPEAGAPILAVLEAAERYGVASYSVAGFEPVDLAETYVSDRSQVGLLLGVDLPGPHTVLATPEGWWSWGELHCPCEWPDAVVEEAWEVSWR